MKKKKKIRVPYFLAPTASLVTRVMVAVFRKCSLHPKNETKRHKCHKK